VSHFREQSEFSGAGGAGDKGTGGPREPGNEGTREQGNEEARRGGRYGGWGPEGNSGRLQVKEELAVEARCGCDETGAIVGGMSAI
jgi:hypothetical protein